MSLKVVIAIFPQKDIFFRHPVDMRMKVDFKSSLILELDHEGRVALSLRHYANQ